MKYIITKNKDYFKKIGEYNYCELQDMVLPHIIAIDTETTGLNSFIDKVFSVQIGTGEHCYLIDLQEYSTPLFEQECITLSDVFPYLESKTLIFQNAAFDLSFFYEQDFYPKKIFDTMIASTILHNGDLTIFSHSLKAIFERELGIIIDKDEQKNILTTRLSSSQAIDYCFNDVDNLILLHTDLFNKLALIGSEKTYLMNCDFIKAMAFIERSGLPIDSGLWESKIKKDELTTKRLAESIKTYIWDNLPKLRNNQLDFFDTSKKILVSLSSPKQMISVFKGLNIPCIDDEGKESIAEKVINKCTHPFVDLWLSYQEVNHNVTTFGTNILNKITDGRIYTRFRPIVNTNRMVSRTKEINFLNFPNNKDTRSCFVAKPGNKMIVCDYSNQEVICLLDLSQDSGLLDNVTNNRDSHSKTAKSAFPEIAHLSDKEVKELHADKRQVGKIINFTVAFGGKGYTISKNLNTTPEEGNRLYNSYRDLYPGVFVWGDRKLEESINNGFIESAMGFKLILPSFDKFKCLNSVINSKTRQFWDKYREGKAEYKAYWADKEAALKNNTQSKNIILNEEAFELYKNNKKDISSYFMLKSEYLRLCLNNPCQATAAHQTKLAVIRLFEYLLTKKLLNKVKICNVIYDEIVLEVSEDIATEMQTILSTIMKEEANKLLTSGIVKMKADANIGDSWYSAK